MRILIEIISIIILSSALGEVLNDAHGDIHNKKNRDFFWRVLIVIVSSFICWCFNYHHKLFQNIVMATCIFTPFFPYLVNYVQFKNKVTSDPAWWNHLNDKTFPDNNKIWRSLSWQTRAIIYLLILIAGSIYYWL